MTRRFLPGLVVALGVLVLGLAVAFTVGRYPVSLAELAASETEVLSKEDVLATLHA